MFLLKASYFHLHSVLQSVVHLCTCDLHPHSFQLFLFRGPAVMCRPQTGDILLRGEGHAGTREPLANPPSARHGTFAEEGPPTLKACNREQTQQ